MHPIQNDILNSLRYGNSRRFSELLNDVAETSDNLTYHLKQLQKNGFIQSPSKGNYELDNKGMIYLNNNLELDHDLFPTVSCMLELNGPNNTILAMYKLKQPYLGSVHLPTFGVTSFESLGGQVDRFLKRYHIKASHVAFQGLHRERMGDNDRTTFDKFFVIFRGQFTSFENDVDDRRFIAKTRLELVENPQLLSASKEVLSLGRKDIGFTENSWYGE